MLPRRCSQKTTARSSDPLNRAKSIVISERHFLWERASLAGRICAERRFVCKRKPFRRRAAGRTNSLLHPAISVGTCKLSRARPAPTNSPFLLREWRRCTTRKSPKRSGKSRQAMPVRYRYSTASTNRRLSRAVTSTLTCPLGQ